MRRNPDRSSVRCLLDAPPSRGMTPGIDRRTVTAGLLAALATPARAAGAVTDSSGRAVNSPDQVTRVFPAGPPAAITLYTLAPDLLLGWPRANRPEEREYLLPDIGARPEIGRIT